MLELIQIQPEFGFLFCFFSFPCVGYAQIKCIKFLNVKIAPIVCVGVRQNYTYTNM